MINNGRFRYIKAFVFGDILFKLLGFFTRSHASSLYYAALALCACASFSAELDFSQDASVNLVKIAEQVTPGIIGAALNYCSSSLLEMDGVMPKVTSMTITACLALVIFYRFMPSLEFVVAADRARLSR
jgi:hypothetical protein